MGGEAARSDDERRVEELLRANAELAAEIRSLTSGRTAEPRSDAAIAARRVSRLTDQRDSLAAELEAARSELDRLGRHNQELEQRVHDQALHAEGLSKETERLNWEVTVLRSGVTGFLRRLRARLLRRR
jgi:cell division protein FtsB